jgi:DUF4097 and DUF4098 domain-containing protein YvlB
MRSPSIALTGLAVTIFVSSIGCDLPNVNIGGLTGKEKAIRISEFNVPIPEASKVEIRTENGRVRCVAGDVTEIEVEAEITAWAKSIELAEEHVEQITVERFEEDGVAKILANIPRRISGSVALTIIVPADTQLNIRTTNGAIEVKGPMKRTAARTSNGKIDLEDCVGEIEARSSNGKVKIEGELLTKVKAETSNGSIEIDGTLGAGDHYAETSNGSIHVELEGAPVRITADTSNGRIRANGRKIKSGKTFTIGPKQTEPPTDDNIARLSLDTSNGSITVEHEGMDDDDGEDDDDEDDEEDDDEDDDERIIKEVTKRILEKIDL